MLFTKLSTESLSSKKKTNTKKELKTWGELLYMLDFFFFFLSSPSLMPLPNTEPSAAGMIHTSLSNHAPKIKPIYGNRKGNDKRGGCWACVHLRV